ncbi:MAG: hypothetical protein HY318_15785, partial [Armatimonadetes bacterium]|nr:hypothetical protein [Armatimonadota bacterium]
LLRKQWIENERLQFPLTQLPLEMVKGDPLTGDRPFLAQPSVWIGFAIPFIWHSLSALHRHNNLFPTLTLGWGIPLPRGAFTLSVNILFEVIGLSYLLSTDISFSLWFVALMGSLETWALPLLGVNAGKPEGGMDPGTPPVAYQGLGAMTVLVAMSVWRARSHLIQALRQAFGRVKGEEDSEEAIPCRVAVWGVLAGVAFLLGWLNWSGIPLFPAAVFLLVTFVIFTGLSRVVAQAGIAYGRPPVAPNIVTLYGLGYNALGAQGLCAMGLGAAWALDVRTLVMAAAANGFKLAGASGLALRRLVPVMMLAALTALVASSWSFITLAHKYGGVTLGGWHILGLTNFQMGWLVDKLNSKPGVEPIRFAYMGLGAAFFLILAFLRERFFGFPLHPVGLCLGLAGPFAWVWFSVFIAWLIKVVVMRYWGGRGYARTRPVFLGLILGSFSAAGFWWIVDAITGTQGNVFTLG